MDSSVQIQCMMQLPIQKSLAQLASCQYSLLLITHHGSQLALNAQQANTALQRLELEQASHALEVITAQQEHNMLLNTLVLLELTILALDQLLILLV